MSELEAQLEKALKEPVVLREEPVEDKSAQRLHELESTLASTRLQLERREQEYESQRQTILSLKERLDDQNSVIKKLQHESAMAIQVGGQGGDVIGIMQEQFVLFLFLLLLLKHQPIEIQCKKAAAQTDQTFFYK